MEIEIEYTDATTGTLTQNERYKILRTFGSGYVVKNNKSLDEFISRNRCKYAGNK